MLAGWAIGHFSLSSNMYCSNACLKSHVAATFELKSAARGGILLMTHILQTRLYPLGITIHYGSASLLLSS